MTGFLSSLFWALLAFLQFIAGLLFSALACVLWLLWPVVLVGLALGLMVATAQPAEAGWFSWLWGSSDTRQIERSAELAQEAARVASHAAQAQADQAAAQAGQNARVAEAISQLSQERQSLADHLSALSDMSLQDSRIAAVLGASGPVLTCVAILLLAGLALWMVTRASRMPEAQLADAMDLLVTEMAEKAPPEGYFGAPRLGGPATGANLRLPLLPAFAGNGRDKGGPHPALEGPEPDGPADDDPMPF